MLINLGITLLSGYSVKESYATIVLNVTNNGKLLHSD